VLLAWITWLLPVVAAAVVDKELVVAVEQVDLEQEQVLL
jgi:hypothetical protein